jgi:hypothetical protein
MTPTLSLAGCSLVPVSTATGQPPSLANALTRIATRGGHPIPGCHAARTPSAGGGQTTHIERAWQAPDHIGHKFPPQNGHLGCENAELVP